MRAAGRFGPYCGVMPCAAGAAPLAGRLIEGTWVTPELAEMTIAACPEGYCGVLSKIVITDEHVAKYGVAAAEIKVESYHRRIQPGPGAAETGRCWACRS